jgi:acyl-CoA thioesterase-2
MGDLAKDTMVAATGPGRYTAVLSREWEIWGPMGGYVAAVALRAAGASSPLSRPASFFCHYLGVASFNEVEIDVTTQRSARTACSQHVSIRQGERAILEADVWSTGEVDGLQHHEARQPSVPDHGQLVSMEELLPDDAPMFAFWNNVETKPVDFEPDWPPDGPREPVWRSWARFRPTAAFDDPWVDAARYVILVDVQGWPAASRLHAWRQPPYIAPSLDLYVAFHEPDAGAEWLLTDGHAPTAGDGLVGWTGRLWSPAGRLVASGAGQALCRRIVPESPS